MDVYGTRLPRNPVKSQLFARDTGKIDMDGDAVSSPPSWVCCTLASWANTALDDQVIPDVSLSTGDIISFDATRNVSKCKPCLYQNG